MGGWSHRNGRPVAWRYGFWHGLLLGIGRGFLRIRLVVKGSSVWIRRGWAALSRSEDEFGRGATVGMGEEHVTAGSVEQFRKNLRKGGRSVLSEDALVDDAACNFDSGRAGYLTENLVEAGVVRGDGENGVGVGNLGALRWLLRRSGRIFGDCSGWCCRQGGDDPGVRFGLGWSGGLCGQKRGEDKAGCDEESDWRGARHVGVGRV